LYLISFVWQARRGATIDPRSAAAAAAIAARCGPSPFHITDRLGGPAVAMYRSPDGHMTFVSAPRGQPGGINRVVNYIATVADSLGLVPAQSGRSDSGGSALGVDPVARP